MVLYDVKTIEEHWTSAFFAFRLGAEPTSLAHLVGVGLGLMALALAATLVPAMGATRIDPLETIRVE
ncbi:MAG: hypothetical protein VX815_05540 [Gemmatimonadota bacterium]|nr:hypothetical protein [Gemmatimonadota bacterium]